MIINSSNKIVKFELFISHRNLTSKNRVSLWTLYFNTRCTRGRTNWREKRLATKRFVDLSWRIVSLHVSSPRWVRLGSFDGEPQLLPQPISAPASPANDYRPLFIFLFRLRMHSCTRAFCPRIVSSRRVTSHRRDRP